MYVFMYIRGLLCDITAIFLAVHGDSALVWNNAPPAGESGFFVKKKKNSHMFDYGGLQLKIF